MQESVVEWDIEIELAKRAVIGRQEAGLDTAEERGRLHHARVRRSLLTIPAWTDPELVA
jgi:hypothetical protein